MIFSRMILTMNKLINRPFSQSLSQKGKKFFSLPVSYLPLSLLGLAFTYSCFISPIESAENDAEKKSPSAGMTLSEKLRQLSKEKESSGGNAALQDIQLRLVEERQRLKDALALFSKEMIGKLSALEKLSPSDMKIEREKELQQSAHKEIETIKAIRDSIRSLEEEWKSIAIKQGQEADDDFDGIWHQPDTTLGQLVIDYNVSDVVYIMPPEIAAMKVHLSSQMAIPKSSWSEMLELIMAQMGVGVKQTIPFVKQLYFLRINQSGLQTITDDRMLLQGLSENSKVAFILAPPAGDLRRVFQFLEKFAPQEQMAVQVIGGQLVVVGLVREINEILKVYDFITSPKRAQEYKLVSLEKGDSEEIAKILMSIFEGDIHRGGESSFSADRPMNFIPQMGSSGSDASFGFRVIPMKQPSSSLFLMGKAEQIEKACQIISDIETNIGEVQDKTIWWYACQHSESEELAKVLSQVYTKLISARGQNGAADKMRSSRPFREGRLEAPAPKKHESVNPPDSLIVQSSMVGISDTKSSSSGQIHENFIVDPKTNSIIMVVENYILPKLKDLLKKLDVPKRMVQIDVLMFEKRVTDSSSFGLNLLKTGALASGKHNQSIGWNDGLLSKKKKSSGSPDTRGILQFALSRGKGGALPPYELAYQFLLSQEDIQINANPSIVTVNQTPAKIAVVDQISINTGAVEFDRDHFKEAYSRAEYGITIQITPTVHAKIDQIDDPDSAKYVTLATEILFDTTRPDRNDRPEVTRRNIKNEVRVRDGETVILGGLRKKHSSGSQHAIPFLGELPGIGKLFSTTALSDTNSEMFIFITPKIVPDNREAAMKLRYEELIRRPGDTPEFLEEIEKAKTHEKRSLFERSLQLILSPPLAKSESFQ